MKPDRGLHRSVELSESYNCHCLLRLDSGREVVLDKLTQTRVYAGLMLGTPSQGSNDHLIKWHLEQVEGDSHSMGKPYFIIPQRRDYFREPGDMQSILERQADRPDELKRVPEWLPHILCVGEFRSLQPARDKTKDASFLVIVWFQDEYGLDELTLNRLREINWDLHATDWQY